MSLPSPRLGTQKLWAVSSTKYCWQPMGAEGGNGTVPCSFCPAFQGLDIFSPHIFLGNDLTSFFSKAMDGSLELAQPVPQQITGNVTYHTPLPDPGETSFLISVWITQCCISASSSCTSTQMALKHGSYPHALCLPSHLFSSTFPVSLLQFFICGLGTTILIVLGDYPGLCARGSLLLLFWGLCYVGH